MVSTGAVALLIIFSQYFLKKFRKVRFMLFGFVRMLICPGENDQIENRHGRDGGSEGS